MRRTSKSTSDASFHRFLNTVLKCSSDPQDELRFTVGDSQQEDETLWSTTHVCVARTGWICGLDSLAYSMAVVVLLRIFRHAIGGRLSRRILTRCIIMCILHAFNANLKNSSNLCKFIQVMFADSRKVRCQFRKVIRIDNQSRVRFGLLLKQ